MGGLRDKAAAHRLQETLLFAKQVIVSYAGLLLTMDMFPQVSLRFCIKFWACCTVMRRGRQILVTCCCEGHVNYCAAG